MSTKQRPTVTLKLPLSVPSDVKSFPTLNYTPSVDSVTNLSHHVTTISENSINNYPPEVFYSLNESYSESNQADVYSDVIKEETQNIEDVIDEEAIDGEVYIDDLILKQEQQDEPEEAGTKIHLIQSVISAARYKTDANFICIGCDITLPTLFSMEEHIRTHHATIREIIVAVPQTEVDENGQLNGSSMATNILTLESDDVCTPITLSNDVVVYMCHMCKTGYDVLDLFEDHFGECVKLFEDNNVEAFKEMLNKKAELLRDPDATNKQYIRKLDKFKKCKLCNAEFQNSNEARKHINSCPMKYNPSVRCEECLETFKHKSQMRAHHMLAHKEHQCYVCGESVRGFEPLRCHIMDKHPGRPFAYKKKNYICEYCSETFTQKSYLTDHVGSEHLGLTHECEDCGKVLTSRNSLIRHQKNHHQEEVFKCEECDRKFKRKDVLKRHMLIFHPELLPIELLEETTCPFCGKRFSQKGNLQSHIEVRHISELQMRKYFICKDCGQDFLCNRYLRRHIKVHHPHNFKKKSEFYHFKIDLSQQQQQQQQQMAPQY